MFEHCKIRLIFWQALYLSLSLSVSFIACLLSLVLLLPALDKRLKTALLSANSNIAAASAELRLLRR